MRTITIKRPIEVFNMNCGYKIYIGSEQVASLRNGGKKTIETNSNADFIKGKIYWCGSKKIKLIETTTVEEFEISGSKFLNRSFPLLAIIPLLGISFTMFSNREIEKLVGLILLLLLLAFVIIVLTIKRSNWLNIRKIN